MNTPMTYARARLWIGICGVGTFVVLASALLAFQVPQRLFGSVVETPLDDALTLLGALATAALVTLPFDLLGGHVLPRRFGRSSDSLARFAKRWLRGVVMLLALSSLSGAVLLAAGRAAERPGAIAAFVLLCGAALLFQEPLARLVGGLRRANAGTEGVIELRGNDPGFSGGFTGASATLVLPSSWREHLAPEDVALLVERRREILRSGAWRRGLVLALGWNALGFTLASLLPGAGVTSVAELATTALGFTLWTFAGLLILPTPSRLATQAADARIALGPEESARLVEAVRSLDHLNEDEPERSAGLESIFHPVPSVATRRRALQEPRAVTGRTAWHLARTALYLSHVGLSLLPRVVHCNAGRPELWVYMPADG